MPGSPMPPVQYQPVHGAAALFAAARASHPWRSAMPERTRETARLGVWEQEGGALGAVARERDAIRAPSRAPRLQVSRR